MHTNQHDYYHNESIFSSQDEDLKTTEQVLEALAQETDTEWVKENLQASKKLVKQKRGVQ